MINHILHLIVTLWWTQTIDKYNGFKSANNFIILEVVSFKNSSVSSRAVTPLSIFSFTMGHFLETVGCSKERKIFRWWQNDAVYGTQNVLVISDSYLTNIDAMILVLYYQTFLKEGQICIPQRGTDWYFYKYADLRNISPYFCPCVPKAQASGP